MKKIKQFILKRLGILTLKKNDEELKKKLKAAEKRCSELEKTTKELFKRLEDLEKMFFVEKHGLNTEEREKKIIVSLTSFPARIPYISLVLQRLLMQTVKPDKVVLWLSKDQFPNREADVPEAIVEMKKYGVEIEWCDGDMRAYKKILPALEKYPDDLIIIIDDDMIYELDFVEKMYAAHQEFPNAIIASRVHRIGFNEEGKILSYNDWEKECDYDTYQSHKDWFLTGGAGTLFPPHVYGEAFFDEKVIKELCPLADDIWLNIHAAMEKVDIVNIATNKHLPSIHGTQAVRLWDVNKNQNDVQLKKLLDYYKDDLQGTVYENGMIEWNV